MRHGSGVSRGDLLRALQLTPTPEEQALAAPLLGYVLPTPPPLTIPAEQSGLSVTEQPAVLLGSQALPGQPSPEIFYVLQSRRQYATPESLNQELPPALQGVPPLQDDELLPFAPGAPIPWQPILPAPRLSAFLRQSLSRETGRRLDVAKLVKQAARLKMPARLPCKAKVLPAGRVVVLLDLNQRLRPFWQDAEQLCAAIERKHGRNGLEIRVLDDNPQGEFQDWFDPDRLSQPWRPLLAQSAVFIVSDLGQLPGAGDTLSRRWLSLLLHCRRQGLSPLVLAPLAACQQQPELQNAARQILWHKHSRLRPQRLEADQESHRQAVSRVLGLLSVAAHVEPELLRAILACLPARQADSGVEAAAWLHDDVQWGYAALAIKPEKRAGYQEGFKREPAELQQQVLSLLKNQHIGQFPAVWAEEVLNARPLVNFDLSQLADVPQAEQFMLRLSSRYHGSQAHAGLNQYARRHLQRLGPESKRRYREYASALYGMAYKAEIRQGAEIPPEYDATIVQKLTGEKISPQRYFLRQQGQHLLISPQNPSQYGWQSGVLLTEFTAGLDRLRVTQEDGRSGLLPPLFNAGTLLPIELTGQSLSIDTGLERLDIAALRKPGWAQAIAQTPTGLKAYLNFAGHEFTFSWSAGVGQEALAGWLADDYAALFETPGAQQAIAMAGFDAYGLYVDLSLGSVQQRFRWLEPGTFEMGSPEHEAEREWNGHEGGIGTETLHQVTLSQGFWLADTAVSQAFWQTVMGDNPSSFKDHPYNPVERVSWNDAQLFIGKLNDMFPGLQAMLPSEAQWEYACRAGTKTAFSFGDNITPEQINYDGGYPYPGGEKGLYRERTVPVKSLPANPWGLYEMHGNVWEWCADAWQQRMLAEPVTDPLLTATDMDSARVVRGGSWNDHGRNARSAFRFRLTPDFRGDGLGFRLALGHAELQPGQAGGAVPQESASGAGAGRRVAEQRQTGPGPLADKGKDFNIVKKIKGLFGKGRSRKK